MSDHPYKAPLAALDAVPFKQLALYLPGQAGAGAFLGGPVAASYFIWANYRALGDGVAASRTVWAGALITVIIFAVAFMLPTRSSSLPLSIAQVIVARMIVQKFQEPRVAQEPQTPSLRHSNWKVVGLSVLWLAATLGVLLALLVVAGSVGLLG